MNERVLAQPDCCAAPLPEEFCNQDRLEKDPAGRDKAKTHQNVRRETRPCPQQSIGYWLQLSMMKQTTSFGSQHSGRERAKSRLNLSIVRRHVVTPSDTEVCCA